MRNVFSDDRKCRPYACLSLWVLIVEPSLYEFLFLPQSVEFYVGLKEKVVRQKRLRGAEGGWVGEVGGAF